MGTTNLPTNYLLQNQASSKSPVIVLKIDGLSDVLSSRPLQTRVLYGDPQVVYGQSGLVYGGFRPYSVLNEDGSLSSFKDLLSLDGSSLNLGQRLEPEQGKASVSTLSLGFIDKNNYMSELISPNVMLPELLLRGCEVYLGFENTSYPQDYFRVFRGYISGIDSATGLVTLQISDANIKLRSSVFYTTTTTTTAALTSSDSEIPVVNNNSFYLQVSQPDGSAYNRAIHTYCQIEDEIIECQPLFQDNEKYSKFIQGLIYTSAYSYTSNVSIVYTTGATAGSEVVTVSSNKITVQIQSGVSTATQVAAAINKSVAALKKVSVYIYPPDAATTQVAQSETFMSQDPYLGSVIQGISYWNQPAQTGISIEYSNTGTAGAETVTAIGNAITVHIQSGSSTTGQIATALRNFASIVDPIVRFKVLDHAETKVNTLTAAIPLTSKIKGRQLGVVSRGARGTVAASHDPNVDVSSSIQVGDLTYSENSLDMAMKIMLSGWAGVWKEDVAIENIGINPDPQPTLTTTSAITFPNSVDVIDQYGLSAGDFIYINGSGFGSNNFQPLRIVRFEDFNQQKNRIVYVDQVLTKELITSATVSFRSQFDVYPRDAGMMLTPVDVDVEGHTYIKNTFMGGTGFDLIFYITSQESSAKTFIQTEIYFPVGAYGLTRYGRLSCGYNSPPLANQTLTTLDETNILNPSQIKVSRNANNRTLFNEIDISYAPDDLGNFTRIFNEVSSDSITNLGGFTSVLPVSARGLYKTYPENLILKFSNFLLNRYAFGASLIPVTVNWEAGSVIQVGDVVILDDSKGILQITNFNTGERGLGKQLFNVIDWGFDFKAGNIKVLLQGNLGASVTDRFATISPSSVVDVGSSTSTIVIKDSFGALYPNNESKKWANYIGLPIIIHDFEWTHSATVTLTGIDTSNNYILHTSTIPFTPTAGMIIDVDNYPTSTDPTVNEVYKLMHVFLDPTVEVVTGVDSRNLTVSGGDITKFLVGAIIRIHSYDYSIDSGEIAVKLISGNQITVDQEIGFTPSAGQLIDLIGFKDAGAAYRFL